MSTPSTANDIIRRIILERFVKARRDTFERLHEAQVLEQVNVNTYLAYDSNGNVLCEDVVIESRP